MFSRPMLSQRFVSLFWRRFLCTFNDNLVRQILAHAVPVRGRGRQPEISLAFVMSRVAFIFAPNGSTLFRRPVAWASASTITAPRASAAPMHS